MGCESFLWRGQLMHYSRSDSILMQTRPHVWKMHSFRMGLPREMVSVSSLTSNNRALYVEMSFWIGDSPQVLVAVQLTTEGVPAYYALEAALAAIKGVATEEKLPEWAQGTAEATEVDDSLREALMHQARQCFEETQEAKRRVMAGSASPVARWDTVRQAMGVVEGEPADAVEDTDEGSSRGGAP